MAALSPEPDFSLTIIENGLEFGRYIVAFA
jgi:hypothetical protein